MAGPSRSPTWTWATDAPGSVATVNEAGLVTIVGQGWANITCTHGSLTGSKQIWGRWTAGASWSGTHTASGAAELWGDFRDSKFCETHGGVGSSDRTRFDPSGRGPARRC
ncbi:MAG: Ig-like domain-containing protein [Sphingobacterium sp.]|nr:Ig-like domain-containing protein [Sphingobacterium sp.]